MGKKVAVLLVAAACLARAVAARAAEPDSAAKLAQGTASTWLALVDAGRYAESWTAAARLFRDQVTSEQWEKAVRSAREPLGRHQSRSLRSAEFTRTLPGAPDGEYVVLLFDLRFREQEGGRRNGHRDEGQGRAVARGGILHSVRPLAPRFRRPD